jgi:hypothetical protein
VTKTFTIESSSVGKEGERASLTLGPYANDSFRAEVRRDRLHATADIVSRAYRGYPSEGLADFFSGLAADWKGWTGLREWSSFENDLKLSAQSPRGGGVLLSVHINHGAPPYWELDFGLGVEPGQLDGLAAEARGFEQSARRAT